MTTHPDEDRNRQDRRTYSQRRPAASVPSITGIRLSPHGIDATLINISETGLLAECAERLKPGTTLTVIFAGTFDVSSVQGRVSRIAVSMATSQHLRYHIGIVFSSRIVFPDDTPPAPPQDQTETRPASPAPRTVRNRW